MDSRQLGYIQPADQVARMADVRRGVRKACKIKKVLEAALSPAPWTEARGLDVGCGPGTITAYLSRYFREIVGIDIDAAALDVARRRFPRPNLDYVDYDAARFPFADASFDIVICNHVYEHVSDPRVFFREISRVTKPSGVVYFAAATKYQIIEPHYGLPFLSWLPPPLADNYLQIAGRKEAYRIYLRSYRAVLGMLTDFEIREYTADILSDPRRFGASDVVRDIGFVNKLVAAAARFAPAALPTRIFLLKKVNRYAR